MTADPARTAFVTGCSSGFGHALARRLLSLGWRVVATDPTLDGWPEALGAPRPDLIALQLDVRDGIAVARAAEEALRSGEVDLLVNNAGYAVFAAQEEAPIAAFRDLLDVNVVGVVQVTQALLPSLRRARGTVVQISSVAGRTVFPESGFYAATKYAVEALSEALFQEVAPFGVRVRLVEPGSFATQFPVRAAAASPSPSPDSPYAALRTVWQARKAEVLEPPQDPELVVDAIVATLADPAPFRRVPVGPDAVRMLALRDALGPDAWSRLAADRNGLEAPHGPGEVPSPREILALPDGDPGLALARTALDLGHLGHWGETAEGRRALERLGSSR